MTFEEYVHVHKDDKPVQKLAQLVDSLELAGNNRVYRAQAGNREDQEYYSREYAHMMRRAEWLFTEIKKLLEGRECADCMRAKK
ncbi:MAG: hypothetical protein IJ899_14690 [Blautia sp.]|nr:hypothetical protein [Blautia sp.]